ncbi:KpsF/GutQ family sugar-phosphate isomerase [Arcticibacter tournemirensis]|uniref:KpsF/GutQ family sugar-phosphate isomerase n=1 Tax=Arcticibacter tournemirensis TaxID=699437 RepID=A0A4Q0MFB9_9SPHI|nr:KpsF/GutQ family sugar-phosphate isomerase [Arcticibacter tournemirensis]RXF72177.1 KpsF/GutQ family sugar-phosphate isomerase [Arcticibacter tournemirensis]
MKTNTEVLQIAKRTLEAEVEGISGLAERINNDFYVIIERILSLKGRVVVTGVGKSALIAQKIVATFNSTGTPSVFMHAADAVHGDLGIIQKDDLVICISKSGNTSEIKILVPLLKHGGNTLVGMVGDKESYLARQADYVLDTTVEKEACPLNLAPTTSTTAQLVMGDILAVCLLECRSFSSEDFAKFHPGGSLGKRLYLKVSDLYVNNEKPEVPPHASVKEVIIGITRDRLGATVVVNKGTIEGIITDGDIRRMMEKYDSVHGLEAKDIMSKSPRKIESSELAVNALELMRSNNITQLIVADNGEYKGVVHLHDLLKEGII